MHEISQNGINIAVLDGNEDVEELLNIDGRRSVFKDEIFDLDSWHFDEAINYLVGIYSIYAYGNEPGYPSLESITTLEGLDYQCGTCSLPFFRELSRRFDKAKKLWISGSHKERNPIKYYIDWAIKKKINIPWLEYAIELGVCDLMQLPNHGLNKKVENNLHRIIWVLKDALINYPLPLPKNGLPIFESQNALLDFIEERYEGFSGTRKSHLGKVFAEANKLVK